MKYASDFKRIAINALSGRWGMAVIAGLLASLLGNVAPEVFEIKANISGGEFYGVVRVAGQDIAGWSQWFTGTLMNGALLMILGGLVAALVCFLVESVVGVGYARFNLDLVDRQQEPEIGMLFRYFTHWKTITVAAVLQALYVFLWSLLFVIPGIVAGYSYAMTNYILAEHPELTAGEAIERSKQMMFGNRFRLFCLQFSFIGWELLCAFTFGIGNLWLAPYKQAATAAFYREVSGTERVTTADEAAPVEGMEE